MNRYAMVAERHWRKHAPERVAALEDPTAFFTALGERVQSQVDELTQHLAGPDLPDENYLHKMGRLRAAQNQAEEAVLSELVWITPEQSDQEGFDQWSNPNLEQLLQWAAQAQELEAWADEPTNEWPFQVATPEQIQAQTNFPMDIVLAVRTHYRASDPWWTTDQIEGLTAANRQQWETVKQPTR